jgi:hypothetical protein
VKVEGPKSSSATGPVQRARSTGGTGGTSGKFAAELDRVTGAEESDAAPAVEGGSGVAGVGGILAAQAVNDREQSAGERRRKAQRGMELLERLEDIRRGLLLGRIPKDRLAELARMVRDKRERGTDPVIARLLDEIELRAAVEPAKLGLPAI